MKSRISIQFVEPDCNGDRVWLLEDISRARVSEGLLTVWREGDYTLSFELSRIISYTLETYSD